MKNVQINFFREWIIGQGCFNFVCNVRVWQSFYLAQFSAILATQNNSAKLNANCKIKKISRACACLENKKKYNLIWYWGQGTKNILINTWQNANQRGTKIDGWPDLRGFSWRQLSYRQTHTQSLSSPDIISIHTLTTNIWLELDSLERKWSCCQKVNQNFLLIFSVIN